MRENKGITLVALIITIIVMLILAGVSVQIVINTDIFGIAEKAGSKMKAGYEEESNTSKVTIDGKEYNSIEEYIAKKGTLSEEEWASIIADASANPEKYLQMAKEKGQNIETNTDIGLGTDGNPVNMDLWEYSLIVDTITYALNDEEAISGTVKTSGYLGDLSKSNGKIEGTIPQYISQDNGATYLPVTNMRLTFYQLSLLNDTPKIPSTIDNMQETFRECSSLTFSPTIPDQVTTLRDCFNGANNLQESPSIPDSVENMQGTFKNCQLLRSISSIGKNVTNLQSTFHGCTGLLNAPIIPSKVETMANAFYLCSNLSGEITIISPNVSICNNCLYKVTNEINLKITQDSTTYQTFYENYKDTTNILFQNL